MEFLTTFLGSKAAKRFYWSALNLLMGFFLALLTYLVGENVYWAGGVLVVANGFSQMLTKYLNRK